MGNRSNAGQAAALGRQAQKNEAERFAQNILPLIDAIRRSGVTTLAGIAEALNARGLRSARGGKWHVSSVQGVLEKAER